MTRKVNGTCVSVEYLILGMIRNNVFIISDDAATIVVDPSCNADEIIKAAGKRNIDAIVLTHRHSDHVGAAKELREKTGATVIASALDAPWITGEKRARDDMSFEPCPVDHTVADGDILKIGNMPWKVLGTPGHTPGGICLFLDPQFGTDPTGAPVLISGDTLFCGSIGRTDFEGGDMGAMRRSLKRLAALPDETIVLPGHESLTKIGDERRRVFAFYAR